MPRNMTDGKCIRGDGGPAVVLQASAALRWTGAGDFKNSLMIGGSGDTDYDVICACADGVTVITRYDRDMLVLSDSEWETCFASAANADVAVVQWFGSDSEVDALIGRLTAAPPSTSARFVMRDATLRLVVGADDGDGAMYGFSEVAIAPGEKVADVYYSAEAQVVVIRPA